MHGLSLKSDREIEVLSEGVGVGGKRGGVEGSGTFVQG